MKRIHYVAMLLIGMSIMMSSCEKNGGEDNSGDLDGIWESNYETDDLFNWCDEWSYYHDENGNELSGEYDAEFTRDIAYIEISGSNLSVYYYVRIVKFDNQGFEFNRETGRIKGRELRRYDYYDLDLTYKFEYDKPHIFIMGINVYDIVSKSKNKMVWIDKTDDNDYTFTRVKSMKK